MRVVAIPCLKDNYAYLLICGATGEAAVVDPSEASPVLKAVAREGVKLTAILNTHHHYDHVGGNKKILKKIAGLKVFAHKSDQGRIPGQTEFLAAGDPVAFGQIKGAISHNPGHTTGAITYYFEDAAFTGDTLFAGGCGRLFEGTPQQMHRSLNKTIGGRDPATKLYFGHEYTESNLRFALTVEPGNQAARDKLDRVRALRREGRFTTPSTVAEEWATNPFMRCDSPEIQATVKQHEPENDLDPVSVFRVIRGLKDRF